jgi:hypothetical protein
MYNWLLVLLLVLGPMACGYAMSCLIGVVGQHRFYVSKVYIDDITDPGYARRDFQAWSKTMGQVTVMVILVSLAHGNGCRAVQSFCCT